MRATLDRFVLFVAILSLSAVAGCKGCKDKNTAPVVPPRPVLSGPVIKPTTIRESPVPLDGLVEWLPWGRAAFDKAAAENKPVMLVLAPEWCEKCAIMDTTTFSDEKVTAAIKSAVVPVRVDPDARPDIAANFPNAEWPLIAFLTPAGTTVKTAGLGDAQDMLDMLAKIPARIRVPKAADYGKPQGMSIEKFQAFDVKNPPSADNIDDRVISGVNRNLMGVFDGKTGRFAPVAQSAMFGIISVMLLEEHMVAANDAGRMAAASLDNLSRMADAVWGGFHRRSNKEVTAPESYEKLLSSNTEALETYIAAYEAFSNEKYLTAAKGIHNYIAEFLADPAGGGFYNAQGSAMSSEDVFTKGADYFALSAKEREGLGMPARDKSLYTGANARAASAFIAIYGALGWENSLRQAEAVLDKLWKNAYRPGRGVTHTFGDKPDSLYVLTDQALVLRALLDDYQATGNLDRMNNAVKLAADIDKNFLYPGEKGYFMTPADAETTAFLGTRRRPLYENAMLSECLLRLSLSSGDAALMTKAKENIIFFQPYWLQGDWLNYLPGIAEYGRAALLLKQSPLKMVVLGKKGDARTLALLGACLKFYEPRKVVFVLDPDVPQDKAHLATLPYKPRPEPTLFACLDTACAMPIIDPAKVAERMKKFMEKYTASPGGGAPAGRLDSHKL